MIVVSRDVSLFNRDVVAQTWLIAGCEIPDHEPNGKLISINGIIQETFCRSHTNKAGSRASEYNCSAFSLLE